MPSPLPLSENHQMTASPPPVPSPPSQRLAQTPAHPMSRRPVPSPTRRHPFYGRFVVALEVLAGLLVVWAIIAGVRTWWGLLPMSYEGLDVTDVETQLRADARAAGLGTFIQWLGLAASVVCVSMVGRLLLSIEGILLRNGQAETR